MILLVAILILYGFSNGEEIRYIIASFMARIRKINTAYRDCKIEIDQLCANPPVELTSPFRFFQDSYSSKSCDR